VVLRRSDKQRRERDDREERKYVAEEKDVAIEDEKEVKKSVRERTQEIEKRLSQASLEEQQQRRDSQLFQGVSEGLERLDISAANLPSDGEDHTISSHRMPPRDFSYKMKFLVPNPDFGAI